ncbi:MAG: type I DNA topoisomerase [Bacteroidales bacterium]|nr:type I DNA topoisomerase [Bacteroidales bacterium]
MIENLVIVESPAKAKTIENFLGKDFIVKSSFGHVRDLSRKNFGVEIDNNYSPQYIVSDDKKKVVAELKKLAKDSGVVWLATDEDREGEAIAWHLSEILKLPPENTKRIVFHEITKDAIRNAVDNPRKLNIDLVNAQQARRILDRLVGFELSPVLWKKIQPKLSAGRVQSVAVRLLVEREREVLHFNPESKFKVYGTFSFFDEQGKKVELKANVSNRFPNPDETRKFLNHCKDADFEVVDIITKPSRKSPAPPFTTSTLQQEASRKLGFSVSQTMTVAQKLYEAGFITYMRTDSVNLSNLALTNASQTITQEFGEKYAKTRKYKTKAKGAQEAHEAVRPTYIQNKTIKGNSSEQRLYDLIWKRTIASQMSEAQLEKTAVTINISNSDIRFIASGEVMKFDGFLKVYIESVDDQLDDSNGGILPPINKGQILNYEIINAYERFSTPPPRYTEASLVKKLEELGIGRPSTYAPTISTIQQRGYVFKEDRPGFNRNFTVISLSKGKLEEITKTEKAGTEKKKLFPKDIGIVVNDFLIEHFKDILNYNFTASVEKEFDEIAAGKLDWTKMIDVFYKSFHAKVEKSLAISVKKTGERQLGNDPDTGDPIIVRIGKFGPFVQLGDSNKDEKPRFASLLKGQLIETITLEEALELFKLPRTIGNFEDNDLIVGIGRFGPYVRHNNKFFSLKKDIDDPLTINKSRAIELIEEKRDIEKKRIIKSFPKNPDLKVLAGRYGPYISYQKKNFRIPRKNEPESLTFEDCMKIIEEGHKKERQKTKGKRQK